MVVTDDDGMIDTVLIDTWWNVNMEWSSVTTAVTKF